MIEGKGIGPPYALTHEACSQNIGQCRSLQDKRHEQKVQVDGLH